MFKRFLTLAIGLALSLRAQMPSHKTTQPMMARPQKKPISRTQRPKSTSDSSRTSTRSWVTKTGVWAVGLFMPNIVPAWTCTAVDAVVLDRAPLLRRRILG